MASFQPFLPPPSDLSRYRLFFAFIVGKLRSLPMAAHILLLDHTSFVTLRSISRTLGQVSARVPSAQRGPFFPYFLQPVQTSVNEQTIVPSSVEAYQVHFPLIAWSRQTGCSEFHVEAFGLKFGDIYSSRTLAEQTRGSPLLSAN